MTETWHRELIWGSQSIIDMVVVHRQCSSLYCRCEAVSSVPVSPWCRAGGGGRQAGVMRLVLVQPNTAAARTEPHTQSSSGASPKTATPTSAAATELLLPETLFQIYCHLCGIVVFIREREWCQDNRNGIQSLAPSVKRLKQTWPRGCEEPQSLVERKACYLL